MMKKASVMRLSNKISCNNIKFRNAQDYSKELSHPSSGTKNKFLYFESLKNACIDKHISCLNYKR